MSNHHRVAGVQGFDPLPYPLSIVVSSNNGVKLESYAGYEQRTIRSADYQRGKRLPITANQKAHVAIAEESRGISSHEFFINGNITNQPTNQSTLGLTNQAISVRRQWGTSPTHRHYWEAPGFTGGNATHEHPRFLVFSTIEGLTISSTISGRLCGL